jgi:hypothetical protein
MAMKVKGKKVQRVATTINESKLKKDEWVVFTDDKVTQDAISSYLSERGEGGLSTKEIHYGNELKVCFSVPFDVVLFLSKNKHRVPYKFTAYHREFKGSSWRIWKEGMKSPGEYLVKKFKGQK